MRADDPPPLRILHIITGLGRGGAERMLYTLCAESVRRAQSGGDGVQHQVISLQPDGAYRPMLEALGVPVVTADARRLWRTPSAIWRAAQHIRKERPAVVQCWMYHANVVGALALMLTPRAARPRLIWGIRCSAMEVGRYSWRLRVTLALHRWLRRRPDVSVANSEAGLRDHLRLDLITAPAEVVANGVDVEAFAPADADRRAEARAALGLPEDAVVALTLARVDPMKDYPLLIATARRTPNVVFLAAGLNTDTLDGPENLRGLGAREDAPRLLAAADFLISCSAYGEGMSNSIAEALAAGLPVVATDVGDAARLVGEAGWIVPPRDADALTAAVAEMAADGGLRRRLGRLAAERMRADFSIARTVERFENLYRTRAD